MSEPHEAWIITKDGEKVPCLLEEIEPSKWQATPVRDVCIDEVDSAGVDLLPAQSSIRFMLVGEMT